MALGTELADRKNHRLIAADISAANEPERLFQQISSLTERVDVLVHNAGHLLRKPLEQILIHEWQQVYATNLMGPALLSAHLLPLLKRTAEESPSHIVHIASMGGVQGSQKFPGLSAYSSSKAALIGLTECMAEEWRPYGICSNVLAIGSVETEMFNNAFPGVKAATDPATMAAYIADFALNGHRLFNGKILQVSNSTP